MDFQISFRLMYVLNGLSHKEGDKILPDFWKMVKKIEDDNFNNLGPKHA